MLPLAKKATGHHKVDTGGGQGRVEGPSMRAGAMHLPLCGQRELSAKNNLQLEFTKGGPALFSKASTLLEHVTLNQASHNDSCPCLGHLLPSLS